MKPPPSAWSASWGASSASFAWRAGEEPADIVFKNATYLNVFSNDFCHGDIAVSDGLIAGIGSYHGSKEVDVSGSFVCPGLIDAHIHLESSLISPAEFARAVIRHGTTTVITDPHEIANVMGVDGVRYMLEATEGRGGCSLYAAQLRTRHAIG